MSQQKPTLGYWNLRGLGQPIRFLLHYLEVDYVEKIYDENKSEEWFDEKEKLGLLFPNLPYFFDGGSKVTESRAIMKHLCRTRKPELLGKTPEVQTRIDMLDYYMYDIIELGLGPVAYQYTDELRKKWAEVDEPKKLRYLADFIKDNKWATGNEITYIDFFTYEIMYHMTVYNPKCLDKYPKLTEYMRRFEELPTIKKFMNSNSYIKSPCFGIHAVYKM